MAAARGTNNPSPMMLFPLLQRRCVLPQLSSARVVAVRQASTGTEGKTMFELMREYRMPASLGALCLGLVAIRRVVNSARKQQEEN